MMRNILYQYPLPSIVLAMLCLLVAPPSQAESRQFGAYEVHYSVFASSFLKPDIAAAYGIVRGQDRGILNIVVRKDNATVEADMKGTRGDLVRKEDLAFRAIREDGAIYYIAEFSFVSAETLYFNVAVTPAGDTSVLRLEFNQPLYAD